MNTPTSFEGFVNVIIEIINLLIPAIFAIVFVYFVWKLIDAWIINAGDEQKLQEGKQTALVAVLVFVVMVSLWGIVAMLQQTIFG